MSSTSSGNTNNNNSFVTQDEQGLTSSTTVAPQASLPQASSNAAEEMQKVIEKPPPIKLTFTLSTLDRKYKEGDEILHEDEEDGDDEEEEEEGEIKDVPQEVIENDLKIRNDVNHDVEGSSTPMDVVSETTSSMNSLNPTNVKSDPTEESNTEYEQQDMNEDKAMEDNDEVESMESNLNSSHHKSNGFDLGNEETKEVNTEESADVEMATQEEDDKDEENDSLQDKDSQQDVSNSEANNRPTRTRSSYENSKDPQSNNDRESISNEEVRAKDDASIDNNTEVKSTNTYSTTSRSALLSERENIGFRDPPSSTTSMTSSFLDSLSEEQRRVRVRHLPNISGFRRLHKSEIKRDVASIKKMLKVAIAKGGLRNESTDEEPSNDTENMDVDGNVAQVSGEETPSDEDENASNKQGKDEDIYNVFSLPFIQSPYICTDIDGQYSNQNSDQEPALFSSPQVVESISAFNPPRPPESVGPKKMHRLHRWERTPQDVEIDLNNYRKTVNRTRQELHKAEMERERVEVVGSHLRSHFLTLLKCMRLEMNLLNQQYDATQIKCVKAAELLTSKTRSRGVARGSYVMKDVISVLRSRGEKLNLNCENGLSGEESAWCVPGIGGVCTDEDTTQVGCGWLLPGDKVSTPCGVGFVQQIYEPTTLDKNAGRESNSNKPPQSQNPQSQIQTNMGTVASRVQVKLPFGVAYFDPSVLTLLQSSSVLNDDKLCARWMAMLDTAKKMGTVPDSKSVDNYTSMQRIASLRKEEKSNDGDDDLTESSTLPDITNPDESLDDSRALPPVTSDVKNKMMVSFGGGLLPLSNTTPNVNLEQMEKNVKMLVKGSSGVVGRVSSNSFSLQYDHCGFNSYDNVFMNSAEI